MDVTDVIELKRARAPEDEASAPEPSKAEQTASDEAKMKLCESLVRSAHSAEALDAPHPDSGVHGHLWRVELSSCLLDPREYERQITQQRNDANEEGL